MPEHPNIPALRQREKTLTEKIAKLKSGELKAEEYEGDGRQEEAILRNEKFLRDVKKEIARLETPATAKTPRT